MIVRHTMFLVFNFVILNYFYFKCISVLKIFNKYSTNWISKTKSKSSYRKNFIVHYCGIYDDEARRGLAHKERKKSKESFKNYIIVLLSTHKKYKSGTLPTPSVRS